MSEPEPAAPRYKIICAGRVIDELRQLIQHATAVGRGGQVMAALAELNRLLAVYPQVGEPLRDLINQGWTQWRHAFPPLVVYYAIDELRREVIIAEPIVTLPYSGFE